MALSESPDKVKKICDALYRDTIGPAKEKATSLIEDAKVEATKIIEEAREEAHRLEQEHLKELEKQRNVADASLNLAVRQATSYLKQRILEELFDKNLVKLVAENLGKKDLVCDIIQAMVEAVRKEGTAADLAAVVAKDFSAEEINKQLVSSVLSELKDNSVTIGSHRAGVVIELLDEKLAIKITDKEVKELLAVYVNDELRERVFNA